jgi:hypothetical protein
MAGPMSSRGTKIYLSDTVVDAPITAVSLAAPAVVTVTGATAVVGDIVKIANTGMSSLDGRMFVVEAAATGTVTLAGSDTTTETGTGAGGVLSEGGAEVEICFASFTRDSPAAATIDVTTLCDDSRQLVSGMPNNGTWTGQTFYDPTAPGQVRLREAYAAGDVRLMTVEPPDKSKIAFETEVNQLSENFAVDQPVGLSSGGIVKGTPVLVLPPP